MSLLFVLAFVGWALQVYPTMPNLPKLELPSGSILFGMLVIRESCGFAGPKRHISMIYLFHICRSIIHGWCVCVSSIFSMMGAYLVLTRCHSCCGINTELYCFLYSLPSFESLPLDYVL